MKAHLRSGRTTKAFQFPVENPRPVSPKDGETRTGHALAFFRGRRHCLGGFGVNSAAMQKFDDCLIQAGAGGVAVVGTSDVAYVHFDASAGGTQVDGGLGRNCVHAVAAGGLFPLLLGSAACRLRFP